MDEWKTIQPTVWKPVDVGDNIIGMLVNKEPKDENSGISAKYYIENEKGTFFVWGCAVIDDRMQYAKIGQKVRITFEGKTKNKRNQAVNLYKVEVSETQAEKTTSDKTRIVDESAAESIEEIDEII